MVDRVLKQGLSLNRSLWLTPGLPNGRALREIGLRQQEYQLLSEDMKLERVSERVYATFRGTLRQK